MKILVVEDDVALGNMLVSTLSSMGEEIGRAHV